MRIREIRAIAVEMNEDEFEVIMESLQLNTSPEAVRIFTQLREEISEINRSETRFDRNYS